MEDVIARDVLMVLQAYGVLFGLQIFGFALVWRLWGKHFADGGWALGRVASSLGIALLLWWIGYTGVAINNSLGLGLAVGVMLVASWLIIKKNSKDLVALLRRSWSLILTEEILFLVGFVGLAIVRGYQPDINGLEKFMDFGFIKSYLSNSHLPGMDMWWATGRINYYTFGHFWASVIIRLMGVPAEVGYNLMLASILGLGLVLSFAIVVSLSGLKITKRNTKKQKSKLRRVIFGGVVGSLLVNLGGNTQVVWYFLKNKFSFERYWYPDATRFIPQPKPNTIHEFPSYSYVVSDLHAHVLGLFLVLSFVLLMSVWIKRVNTSLSVGLGLLLGVMIMTNTWDFLNYGLFLGVVMIIILVGNPRSLVNLFRSGLIIGVVAGLVASQWWMSFEPISDGVGWVKDRTPLWNFAVLWSGHLLITFIALFTTWKLGLKNKIVLALSIVAVILLALPEFIYVKDIYTSHYRANTMFKLTYQSFIMMSLLGGVAVINIFEVKKLILKIFFGVLFGIVFIGVMSYPSLAFKSYYSFREYKGLDGLEWFRKRSPGEAVVVDYLNEHRDGKNIVEAVGESYTQLDAVSAFSGVPTIQGWQVHEWLWRGGWNQVGFRSGEVSEIYQSNNPLKVRGLLDKYNVGWVVVGENERKKYKINVESIYSLGDVAISSFGVDLIKITEFR